MSKERLEEIEAKYSTLTVRVQELEERDNEITKIYSNQIAQMSKLENEIINLQEQNKRYREAIEKIKSRIPIKYEKEIELSAALIGIADEIEHLYKALEVSE